MLIIGLLIGGVLAGVMLIDEGELVTLHTRGPEGEEYKTQLWVIEREGKLYLRAHYPGAKWLKRVGHQPEVKLHRGEASQSFLAGPVDDPEVRRDVNRAMAAKYGLADRIASALWDPQNSVPVRLDRNDGSPGVP